MSFFLQWVLPEFFIFWSHVDLWAVNLYEDFHAIEQATRQGKLLHYKKDTSMTFWAGRFFYDTYDMSMTIIVTKPGIIIDVVGSYFYFKRS